MSLDVLLISDTMIKERTAVHGNIDPKLIYSDIKLAQDMYIHPILGTALYDKMQALIVNGQMSDQGNADYKLLIDRYIVDALIYYTLSELPTTISYQFWNKGIMRKQNENTELPTMSELVDLANKYKNRAEFYANRLKLYLIQNAPSKYKEYLLPGNGVDTIYPNQKSFTMPVYLGDFGCDEYCNAGGFPPNKPYSE